MKKAPILIITLFIVLFSVLSISVFAGTVQFETDFENDTLIQGWATEDLGVESTRFAYSGTKSYKLTGNDLNALTNESMNFSSNIFEYQFRIYINLSDITSYPFYTHLDQVGDNILFAIAGTSNGSALQYSIPAGWADIPNLNPIDAWNKITVVYNLSDNYCDIYVNDVKEVDYQDCDYGDVGRTIISEIEFQADASGDEDIIYLDDLKICDGVCPAVLDITPPTWDEIPGSSVLEYLTDSLYVDFNASDSSGIDTYYINDTTNFKIDSNGLLENNTNFDIGVYQVLVSVNDTSNNINSTVHQVTVQDTTGPTFDVIPNNETLEYLVESLYVEFEASDVSSLGTFYINDTINFKISDFDTIQFETDFEDDTLIQGWATTDGGEETTNFSYSGTKSYKLSGNGELGNRLENLTLNFSTDISEVQLRLYTNPGGSYPFDLWYFDGSGSPVFRLGSSADGSQLYYDCSGSFCYITNSSPIQSWVKVGVIYNHTSNVCDIYINDSLIIDDGDCDYADAGRSPVRQIKIVGDGFLDADVTYIDDLKICDGVCVDGYGILENNTNLGVGTHNVLVSVNDTYNNINSFVYEVDVEDTISPTWDYIPSSSSLGQLVDSLSVDFNATDISGIDVYYINDTTNFQIDSNGVLENNTNLVLGVYQVLVSVNDTYNNINSTVHQVTVQDTINPTWDEIPGPSTLEYLTDSLYVDFNASDVNGIDTYYINDTTNFKIDSNGVLENNTNIEVGVYQVLVSVNDTYNNINSTVHQVTIQDTINPTWDEIPGSSVLEYLTDSLYVDFNASDGSGIDTYYINDTTNFKIGDFDTVQFEADFETDSVIQGWATTDSGVESTIQAYSGTKSYKLEGSAQTLANRSVNFSSEILSVEFMIFVNSSDVIVSYPFKFHLDILGDGTSQSDVAFLMSGNISGESLIYVGAGGAEIEIPNSNLLDNWRKVKVEFDTTNNFCNIYIDDVKEIDYADCDYYAASRNISNNVEIEFHGDAGGATEITYIDDLKICDGICSDVYGVLENNTNLDIGVYQVLVSVNDTSGNINSTVHQVTVQETVSPTWDYIPASSTLEYLVDSLLVDFNASDSSGIDTYYINDTTNFQIDSNGILENNTNLNVGVYQVLVSVNDTYNNINSTVHQVTVSDNINPTWDYIPASSTLEYLSENLGIDFNASDSSGIDTYYINDTTNFKIDNNGVLENDTNLAVGVYQVLVSVNDTFNNINSTIHQVTVQDTSSPTWDYIPASSTLEYLSENLGIDFNASDSSGIDTYYINDTTNFKIDNNGVLENDTNLAVGVYQVLVSVNDTFNNINSTIHQVTVQDTSFPTWDYIPTSSTLEYLVDSLLVDFNVSDISGIDTYYVNDTTNFKIDSNGILENNTNLNIGIYYILVSVNDTSNNINSTVHQVTVQDTIGPTWDEISGPSVLLYLVQALYVDFNASDTSGIDTYYVNDTTNFKIDSNGVLENNTNLNVGVYQVLVGVNDTFNNINSTVHQVTVSDNTNPTWDYIPASSTLEYLVDSLLVDFNASDGSGIDTYYINDTTNFKVDSLLGVLENNTNLAIGVYQVLVSVNDTTGNINTTTYQVTVQDTSNPSFDVVPGSAILEYNIDSLSVDFDASDPSGIDSYYINDTTNFKIGVSNGVLENNTKLSISVYQVLVSVNDTQGNLDSVVYQTTVQDSTDPQITLHAPPDSYLFNISDITFSWTATDNEDSSIDCDLTINSVVNHSTTVTNGVQYDVNVTFPEGVYNWNLTCTDNYANSYTTPMRDFSVGLDAPTVTYHSFNVDNSTSVYTLGQFLVNVTAQNDVQVTEYTVNITKNSTGTLVWSYSNSSITTQAFPYSELIDVSGWENTTYIYDNTVCDLVVCVNEKVLFNFKQPYPPVITVYEPVVYEFDGRYSLDVDFDIEAADPNDDALLYNWTVNDVEKALTEDYIYTIEGPLADLKTVTITVKEDTLLGLSDDVMWNITVIHLGYVTDTNYSLVDLSPIVVDGVGTAGASIVDWTDMLILLGVLSVIVTASVLYFKSKRWS